MQQWQFLQHHINACVHTLRARLRRRGTRTCPAHPPYSLDLALFDFWLFPRLKKELRGLSFETDKVKVTVGQIFDGIPTQLHNGCTVCKIVLYASRCMYYVSYRDGTELATFPPIFNNFINLLMQFSELQESELKKKCIQIGTDLHAQSVLINKIVGASVHRSLVGSLLRVRGSLGKDEFAMDIRDCWVHARRERVTILKNKVGTDLTPCTHDLSGSHPI